MHVTIHCYINKIRYVDVYMINMNVIYISNKDLLYKSFVVLLESF